MTIGHVVLLADIMSLAKYSIIPVGGKAPRRDLMQILHALHIGKAMSGPKPVASPATNIVNLKSFASNLGLLKAYPLAYSMPFVCAIYTRLYARLEIFY